MTDYNVIIPHYSVMLADGLKTIIQDQYQFKHSISMELLSSAMNDLYRVQSGDFQYVLRVPRHERFWPITSENYEFEMRLVNYLRTRDLPVSYPIPTKNKKFIGILNAPEGLRYYSLHTDPEGRKPDTSDIGDMRKVGAFLGKLHSHLDTYSKDKSVSWSLELLLNYGLNRLEPRVPDDLRENFNKIRAKATELVDQIKKLLPPNKKKYRGLIHGEFRPSNLVISENEVIAKNFEYCGTGYRIFDMVYKIHRTNIGNIKNKSFSAFIDGYQQTNNLSDEEIEALPILAKIALISRMTVSVGMINLVGVIWFDTKLRTDMGVLKRVLNL